MQTELRLHDYQKLALRTAPSNRSDRGLSWRLDFFLHGAMGMAAEMHELIQVHEQSNPEDSMVAELGDVMWYFAINTFGDTRDIEDIEFMAFLDEIDIPLLELQEHTSRILDQAKRIIYYGALLNEETYQDSMGKILASVYLLARESGSTLEEVMDKNIQKLKVRYPDKFSEDQAVNRNTHKESKVFQE